MDHSTNNRANNDEKIKAGLMAAVETVRRLRAPDGCPWDKKQTFQSLRPYFVEETYEVLEVLDKLDSPEKLKDPEIKKAFVEELGDVLLQIILHTEIAGETTSITMGDVGQELSDKLIRRHPHVFAANESSTTNPVDTADKVVTQWEKIKQAEKGATNTGTTPKTRLLDKVKHGQPPLPRTMQLIQTVTKVGFQWPDENGPLDKLKEEVQEFENEVRKNPQDPKKLEAELGDVLFSVCNIAYMLKLDPEAALRSTLERFQSRFNFVEDGLTAQGKTFEQSNLQEMDQLWEQAKRR